MKPKGDTVPTESCTVCKCCQKRIPVTTQDFNFPMCRSCWQLAGDELERQMEVLPDEAVRSLVIDWGVVK